MAACEGRLHLFAMRASCFTLAVCRRAVICLCYEVWSNQLVPFGFAVSWHIGAVWLARHSWWMEAAPWNLLTVQVLVDVFLIFLLSSLSHWRTKWYNWEWPEWNCTLDFFFNFFFKDIFHFDWSALYSCNWLFSNKPCVAFEAFWCCFAKQRFLVCRSVPGSC